MSALGNQMAAGVGIAGAGYWRPANVHPDKLASVSVTGTEIDVGKKVKYDKANPYPLLGFTAASPKDEPPHPSGWRARISLEREGRTTTGHEARWRSGEVVSGTVELSKGEGEFVDGEPTSVVVRAFCQSTSFHWVVGVEDKDADKGRTIASGNVCVDMVPFIEWNRTHLIGGPQGHGQELLTAGGAGGTEGGPALRLPFSFALPTRVVVDEASEPVDGLPARTALTGFARTPPGSLPAVEGKHGAVEWTIEAVVRFDAGSDRKGSGSFASGSSAPLKTASFGLAHSTPSVLVHRVVFPFEPADEDTQDLYSNWRPRTVDARGVPVTRYLGVPAGEIDSSPPGAEVVPGFGTDPRDEPLGGAHVGPGGQVRSQLVLQEGGRGKWDTYFKTVEVKGFLGVKAGSLRVEGHVPRPAQVARHAPSLPLILTLAYDAKKHKPAGMDKVVLRLARRTLTLGGNDHLPQLALEDLRRHEIRLAELVGEGAEAKGGSLQVQPGEVRDVRVEFDLQSGGEFEMEGETKRQQALRDLSLTIRTPSIEQDYILTAQVFPSHGESVFLFRVPIQVIAGDHDPAPAFEA